MVNIKTRNVEYFWRTNDNDWLLHVYSDEQACDFTRLDVSLEMSAIFEVIAET